MMDSRDMFRADIGLFVRNTCILWPYDGLYAGSMSVWLIRKMGTLILVVRN